MGADDRDPMHDRILTLTDRERETLRLLVGGHDAKSIARRLDLSIHTINERLRDARRKLGVASSREAARLLAEAERTDPDFPADKFLGVPRRTDDVPPAGQAGRRQGAAHRLVWFSGGMLIMSLLIAAVVLSSAIRGGATTDARERVPAATATSA